LPGEIGMFLAMTGARLKSADCVYAGICDVYIPNYRHDGLIDALRGGGGVEEAVVRFSEVSSEAPLAAQRDAIDRCFAGDSVETIIAALEGEGGIWAEKQLSIMAGKSPTSQKVSHRQLRAGAQLDFDDCMIMEYRISQHLMEGGDFFEGVRAVVVDKDMSPKWSPAVLSDLFESDVEKYFEPLGDRDLTFPT
jgi:enoyl-CoA hydratase